jgi:hypothetical protein
MIRREPANRVSDVRRGESEHHGRSKRGAATGGGKIAGKSRVASRPRPARLEKRHARALAHGNNCEPEAPAHMSDAVLIYGKDT